MDFQELVKRAEARLFIIGEVGVNHNGDLQTAKKLVDVAKDAGCDAVKFQTWITERVYSKSLSIKPEYQLRTTDQKESEFDTIKKLELTFDDFRELKKYCGKKEILFFSTPDEIESADFLVNLGVPMLKTASQDVTNLPFLRYIAETGLPVIFSSGACTAAELNEAIDTIYRINKKLVILHCLSAYPAPIEELNLNVLGHLRQKYNCPIGFSDHTTGVEAACAAVALGARFFEKHLTYDTKAPGPDHQASLDPFALTSYVSTLRKVFKALGDGEKKIMPSEVNTRKAFRRFLVTKTLIKKGHIFTEGDFLFKKTTQGIAPAEISDIIGKKAFVDIPEDVPLEWRYIDAEIKNRNQN